MIFDDPEIRANAQKRVELLRKLVSDLAAIVDGQKPTAEDLAAAVPIRNYSIGQREVPVLVGFSAGHPRLPRGLITTSQLFAIDPKGRWARTMSRFYRLEEIARHGSVQ